MFWFLFIFHKDANGRLQVYLSSGPRTLWEGNISLELAATHRSLLLWFSSLGWLWVFPSRYCWQNLRKLANCTPSRPWRKKTSWPVMRWTGTCWDNLQTGRCNLRHWTSVNLTLVLFTLQPHEWEEDLRDDQCLPTPLPGQPARLLPDGWPCVLRHGVFARRWPHDPHPQQRLHWGPD